MEFSRLRRFVRGLWEGLVTYGRLCAGGEGTPCEEARPQEARPQEVRPREVRPREVRPWGVWGDPPPGHPERVRGDVPLTDLERRLARELSGGTSEGRDAG
ncbi:DUF6059 family protein [Streptomyces ziwulingensis]